MQLIMRTFWETLQSDTHKLNLGLNRLRLVYTFRGAMVKLLFWVGVRILVLGVRV